MILCPASMEIN